MTEGPLLAIIYSPRSRPWAELVEAANGVCRLLWVVDSDESGMAPLVGILRRFGTVVNTAGCTDQEIVQRVHAERPDGITCYFDTDLHRQAWLAEALGLPTASVRSVAMLTDKLIQREALAEAGVPVPRFREVREPAAAHEVERLSEAIGFPAILKPRDGTACRGISKVANREELAGLLTAIDRPGRMILEELMPDRTPEDATYAGRMSIDSVVSRGVISHLGITGLFAMVPPFRSSGGFFPAAVSPDEADDMFKLATHCIQSMGCDTGCYRTEIKLTPSGAKIIEVNGRPTGLTPATVKLASGLSLLPLSMRLALGEHIVIDGPLRCENIAYRYYHEPPMSAVRVIAVDGLDELAGLPGMPQIDIHKGTGDPVDWRNGSLDKVFQVTGTVRDYDELAEHYRACSEGVTVTYEHREQPTQ